MLFFFFHYSWTLWTISTSNILSICTTNSHCSAVNWFKQRIRTSGKPYVFCQVGKLRLTFYFCFYYFNIYNKSNLEHVGVILYILLGKQTWINYFTVFNMHFASEIVENKLHITIWILHWVKMNLLDSVLPLVKVQGCRYWVCLCFWSNLHIM